MARYQAAQLAHDRMRRPRRRQRQPGDRRSDRRPAAEPDPLPDDHRLRRAQQAGHGGDPRRGARRGRGRGGAQGAWAGTRRRSTIPDDVLTAWRAAGKRGAVEHARVEASGSRRAARKDEFLARIDGQGRRRLAQALSRQAARRPEAGRDPQGVGNGAGGDQRRDPGDDRRLGRPHRLEQHQDQGPSSR